MEGMESDRFDQVCETMESKLESRMQQSELLDKGIIKHNLTVSPSIHDKQSKIKFKQSGQKIDRMLHSRPGVDRLVDTNIMVESPETLAPSLQSSKKSMVFHQTQTQLRDRLDSSNRPTHDKLIDSSIIRSKKDGESDLVEDDMKKESLESKLINRSAPSDLLQSNIIKSIDVAPSIQVRQGALRFQQISSTIDTKLNSPQRPLYNNNSNNNNSNNNSNNFNNEDDQQLNNQQTIQSIGDNLDHKLVNRPTIENLINYNILKEEPTSPSIQYKKNKLEFEQRTKLLNSMVESRPPKESLFDHNILHAQPNDDTNSPGDSSDSIDIRQQRLSQSLSSRPSKQQVDHIISHHNNNNINPTNNIPMNSNIIDTSFTSTSSIDTASYESEDEEIQAYLDVHPLQFQK